MEDELVKLYEYKLDKEIVSKCLEEGRDIQSKDVENEIHQILKDNKIYFKNRIKENWKPKVGTQRKINEHSLIAEIYVKETDFEQAQILIEEYLK